MIKSVPLLELDVSVDRARLEADPATALAQTTAVAAAIDRIGPGQDYLIDNISNTLAVASDDAAIGRRLFLFLGLPGLLMAAFLAAYAGSLLAEAQRREHANLRVRGAHRGHLRGSPSTRRWRSPASARARGRARLASAAAILGWAALFEAAPGDLAVSGSSRPEWGR